MIKNDLTGKTFGWWKVVKFSHATSYRKLMWICECKCGTIKTVAGQSLTNGASIKCRRHAAFITHGKSKTPEHQTWMRINSRCNNPNHSDFKYYGGRGIKVCERWTSFETFLQDMGNKPTPSHSIDRIDNNGPYSPKNCRWATHKEQCRNTRANRWITFDGKTMVLEDWAAFLGINHTSLSERLEKWPLEKALTLPPLVSR